MLCSMQARLARVNTVSSRRQGRAGRTPPEERRTPLDQAIEVQAPVWAAADVPGLRAVALHDEAPLHGGFNRDKRQLGDAQIEALPRLDRATQVADADGSTCSIRLWRGRFYRRRDPPPWAHSDGSPGEHKSPPDSRGPHHMIGTLCLKGMRAILTIERGTSADAGMVHRQRDPAQRGRQNPGEASSGHRGRDRGG